jgi:hypothetical protein
MTDDGQQRQRRPTHPVALAMNALAFLRAAQALIQVDDGSRSWPALYVNLSFAIELSLKAFSRNAGGADEDLKKLGHNLVSGFDKATELGFTPSSSLQRKLVDDLSPSFVDMSVRYGFCGWIGLPAIPVAMQVTRALVEDVWRQSSFLP